MRTGEVGLVLIEGAILLGLVVLLRIFRKGDRDDDVAR